jgi:hypothetical protein
MSLNCQIINFTAEKIAGYICTDVIIHRLTVEMNDKWICDVAPTPGDDVDTEATGNDERKYYFSFSVQSYLESAPVRFSRVVLKFGEIVLHEDLIDGLCPFESLASRIAQVEAEVRSLRDFQRFQELRIEETSFRSEKLENMRDEFIAARNNIDYQASYTRQNPLVSICVATMNRAELLIERTLKSLCGQSYTNIQIIVIGDHCTDDTETRISEIRDSRILFENLPQRGPYPRYENKHPSDRWCVAGTHAVNRALSLAEGDFIAHLDDDDECEPERVEILLGKIREARADVVFHRFWSQGNDGSWSEQGNGEFALGQVSTGTVLYHCYLGRVPWDVYAYRFGEPGDWNRFRKFKMMRARTEFVPLLLTRLYRLPARGPFIAQVGEEFLE